jgi:hypothetical protein
LIAVCVKVYDTYDFIAQYGNVDVIDIMAPRPWIEYRLIIVGILIDTLPCDMDLLFAGYSW